MNVSLFISILAFTLTLAGCNSQKDSARPDAPDTRAEKQSDNSIGNNGMGSTNLDPSQPPAIDVS